MRPERTASTSTKGEQLLLILLAAAFVLRVAVFLVFRPWDPQVEAGTVLLHDAARYHRLALCLIDTLTFCGETFRTPGYPFFVAIVYKLFVARPWVALLAQMTVDLATIYFVFKIGETTFSKRAGLVAAAFLAIDPNLLFSASSLDSDDLFVACLMAAMYFYLRGADQAGRHWSLAIAGGMLGMTILIRPVAQYYAFLLLCVVPMWSKASLLNGIKCAVVFGAACAITIGPWVYRNYRLYDSAKISTVQGTNLLFWQVAYTRAWETHRPGDAVIPELMAQARALGYRDDGNPFANEKIAQIVAVHYIKSHPRAYASRWLSGMLHTYTNLGTAEMAAKLGWTPTRFPVENMFATESESGLVAKFFQLKSLPEIAIGLAVMVLLLTNSFLFVLGAVVLARNRRWSVLGLFVLSILYFTVTAGPIGLARFRMPITPFYLLIGAVYVDEFLNRRAIRRMIATTAGGRPDAVAA
jgi:4-amino-4-deoxy-L-arabinose transferase-like glycosyltransferase